MKKEIDDPRREFLVEALSLGLFAGTGLASIFRPAYALGEIPKKLPAGRSIYKLQGSVIIDGKPADINTPIGPNSLIETVTHGGNRVAMVQQYLPEVHEGDKRILLVNGAPLGAMLPIAYVPSANVKWKAAAES